MVSQSGVRDNVKRINLPSGGWWEIVMRPKVRHSAMIRRAMEYDDGTAEFRALAVLTTAWSYDAPVSADYILDMDLETLADLEAVVAVFTSEVVPFLEASAERAKRNGSSGLWPANTSPRNTPTSS